MFRIGSNVSPWPTRWKWLRRLLTLLFFAAVAWLLYRRGREMDWNEVWMSVQAFDPLTLLTGLAFTLLAYLAFGSYDLLARRHLRHQVPAPRVLAIAMVAYALNVNLGALVGGWASRFRLYSRVGLSASTTTQIIGLGILSNWSGYMLVGGLVFAFAPPQLPQAWFLSAWMPLIGMAMLSVLAVYLLWCAFQPGRRWKIRRFKLRTPTLAFASLQLAAAVLHWLATCMVIGVFLPGDLAFSTVLGVLLMSSMAGAALHIPAGLGVIEAVFVGVLGDRFPPTQILGALIAYRACFYLAPLLLALVAFPVLEWRGRRPAAGSRPAPQRAAAPRSRIPLSQYPG